LGTIFYTLFLKKKSNQLLTLKNMFF